MPSTVAMRTSLLSRFDQADIARALAAHAPSGTRVTLYVSCNDPSGPRLLAVVRVPGGALDPEATTWVPHSAAHADGEDAVLLVDHDTILDVISETAALMARLEGFRPRRGQTASVQAQVRNLSVQVETEVEKVRDVDETPQATARGGGR